MDKQRQVVDLFSPIKNWEDRYKKLIELGKQLEPMPEEMKVDDLKVKGCQSQVWIHARLENGKVHFKGDSDALLVKGLIAVVLMVYSDSTPEDIIKTPPDFIKDIGLEGKLSPSRANGLLAMIRQIKYYAMAYAAGGK